MEKIEPGLTLRTVFMKQVAFHRTVHFWGLFVNSFQVFTKLKKQWFIDHICLSICDFVNESFSEYLWSLLCLLFIKCYWETKSSTKVKLVTGIFWFIEFLAILPIFLNKFGWNLV
jgi:hypothetical protein